MDFETEAANDWECDGPAPPRPTQPDPTSPPIEATLPARSKSPTHPTNGDSSRRPLNGGPVQPESARRWQTVPPSSWRKPGNNAPASPQKPVKRPPETGGPSTPRGTLDRRFIQTPKANKQPPRQPNRAQRRHDIFDIDKPPVNLDNAAKGAWRQKKEPDKRYHLPANCQRLYDNCDPQGKEVKTASFRQVLEQIGLRTGAYIQIPASPSDRHLSIWGDMAQIATVTQELDDWLKHRREVLGKLWQKNNAPSSDRKLKMLRDEMAQTAYKERFRKDPDEDEKNDLITGAFLWPTTDIRLESYLGNSLEALDPLRMDLHCFVMWDAPRSLVKILSEHEVSVIEAISRLRGIIAEVKARSTRPSKVYLIDPPDADDVEREVELTKSPITLCDATGAVQPGTTSELVSPSLTGGCPTSEEHIDWEILQPNALALNETKLRQTIASALPGLHCYRGHARARVRFGELSLINYMRSRGKNYDLEEFSKMLRHPQASAEVVRDLERGEKTCNLITRCSFAAKVLDPLNAMTSSLEHVAPDYSACFGLSSLDGRTTLQLEVDFATASTASTGDFDVSARRWFRRETVDASQNPLTGRWRGRVLVAATVVDLPKHAAWQFEIVVGNHLDEARIPQDMQNFARSIRLGKGPSGGRSANGQPNIRIDFKETGVHIVTQEQRSHFRYLLKSAAAGSTYVLEVTRVRRRQYPPAGHGKFKEEITWEASMYDMEWDGILQQQSTLSIGQEGTWESSLRTFFPPPPGSDATVRDGFGEFLKQVKVASDLLASRDSTDVEA